MTSPDPKGEKMTARQRAENILGEICQYIPDSKEQDRYFRSIRKCLEHQIKSAEDAAYKKGKEDGFAEQAMGCYEHHHQSAYERGFAEAKEMAAKMFGCDMGYANGPCGTCGACADTELIRSLRPPARGEGESK